jgi:hypothetical protein
MPRVLVLVVHCLQMVWKAGEQQKALQTLLAVPLRMLLGHSGAAGVAGQAEGCPVLHTQLQQRWGRSHSTPHTLGSTLRSVKSKV